MKKDINDKQNRWKSKEEYSREPLFTGNKLRDTAVALPEVITEVSLAIYTTLKNKTCMK